MKVVWLKIVVKLYETIKWSNFGIMSSPQSLKFDLVFIIFFWFFMNIQKNRKLQIWVNLNHIYANDRFFENFLHKRAWNSLQFFIVFFQDFQHFQIFNFPKFNFQILKNYRNSNLKNHRILNRYKKIDSTTDKSTCQGAFRIVLQKNSLYQSCWEKATPFDSTFAFF
jgi:hypothetical protein